MKVWLSSTKNKVGIPYTGSEVRPDGSKNHGYFDLKRNPARINDVPELKGFPELKRFVQMMNGPESHFRTLGCEKVFSPSDSPLFKRKLVTFVDFAFEVVEWNATKTNCEGLYRAFEEFVGSKGDLPNTYGVEFSIGPAVFNDHPPVVAGVDQHRTPGECMVGWITAIWIFGYGGSDDAARKQWALALRIVHEFFERQNKTIPRETYRDMTTIS